MQVTKLSPEDCDRLKTFFICYTDWFIPNTCAERRENPSSSLVARANSKSVADATEPLQRAIHAVMKMTTLWTPEQVAEADAWLAAAGTFTLSEVRRRFSKKYLRIFRRRVIRAETEYFLIKGIVDYGGVEPGSPEGIQLQIMLKAFEVQLVAAVAPLPSAKTPDDMGTHR
ncbi:hypothetical protein [Variovorax rhizosphaerae]|uniref:Uncharacterized protein n=1 Tax=Variovorax rhizosphaerae TaxID=1836200 RepID=A0ABU8WZ71_9BURK